MYVLCTCTVYVSMDKPELQKQNLRKEYVQLQVEKKLICLYFLIFYFRGWIMASTMFYHRYVFWFKSPHV